MKKLGTVSFAVSSVLALAACGDDGGSSSVSIVTYNIGLATGFVDYAPQRTPIVVDLVAKLDADVVCLQEVWTQEDIDLVIDGAKDAFPHSHHVFLEDTTLGPPACTATESDPLKACVDQKCPDTPASEIAGCALENCNPEFSALSAGCVECIVANIGKEVEEILSICQTSSQKYAYGGHSGLILLSKHPLSQLSHEKLSSTNVQRAVLGARVDLPVLGDTAVVCTHLAADLTGAGVPYNGPHESWAGENAVQAEAALDFADTLGAGADHRVIFGDMNSGPAIGDAVVAEIPGASYQTFLDAGYVDFPTAGEGEAASACTYCDANSLVKSGGNVQIDRIVLSALPNKAKARVDLVGTQTVTIQSGGSDVTTHPSDHFGVRLVLETP